VERLGGVRAVAKRFQEAAARWLAEGIGGFPGCDSSNLAAASGVPRELMRLAHFQGRRLGREALLAVTQRAIETVKVREALCEVRKGLDAVLRSISDAMETQESTGRRADAAGVPLDRRTRSRVKTFLRNAELEIKVLQKELDRPATKAVAA
jgi:hypothetical protein